LLAELREHVADIIVVQMDREPIVTLLFDQPVRFGRCIAQFGFVAASFQLASRLTRGELLIFERPIQWSRRPVTRRILVRRRGKNQVCQPSMTRFAAGFPLTKWEFFARRGRDVSPRWIAKPTLLP
jgi:hypothetical protein